MFIYKGKLVLPMVIDYWVGYILISLPFAFFIGGFIYSIIHYWTNPESNIAGILLMISTISVCISVILVIRIYDIYMTFIAKFIRFHFDNEVYILYWCLKFAPYLKETLPCKEEIDENGNYILKIDFSVAFPYEIGKTAQEAGIHISKHQFKELHYPRKGYKNLRTFIKENEDLLRFALI